MIKELLEQVKQAQAQLIALDAALIHYDHSEAERQLGNVQETLADLLRAVEKLDEVKK
jgi:hypothetical protein